MSVVLRVIRGEPLGARLFFPPGRYLFGRAANCHVRFAMTSCVSRHNCLLCVTEESVSIRDLNSRNSTVVNGERVRNRERILNDADQLFFFSEITFLVEIGSQDAEGASAPQELAGQPPGETMGYPVGRTDVQMTAPGCE